MTLVELRNKLSELILIHGERSTNPVHVEKGHEVNSVLMCKDEDGPFICLSYVRRP